MARMIEGEGFEQDEHVEAAEIVAEQVEAVVEASLLWEEELADYFIKYAAEVESDEVPGLRQVAPYLRFGSNMEIVAPKVSWGDYRTILTTIKPELNFVFKHSNLGDLLPANIPLDEPVGGYEELHLPTELYSLLGEMKQKSEELVIFPTASSLAFLMGNADDYLDFVHGVGNGDDGPVFHLTDFKERWYFMDLIPLWKHTVAEVMFEDPRVFRTEHVKKYVAEEGKADLANIVADYNIIIERFKDFEGRKRPEKADIGYEISQLMKEKNPDLVWQV